jgi:uncharacterized protein YndB with AHSA1/START domain
MPDVIYEIRHDVPLNASSAAIFEALTDVARLAEWWIPDTRGRPEIGQMLEFWFSDKGCQQMRVAEITPDEYVRWDAAGEDAGDWSGTFVEFRISQANDGSVLRFRHAGWRGEVERFPYYSFSWAVFLVSLKDLLEKGKGHPFPNDWING